MTKLITGCEADIAAVESDLEKSRAEWNALSESERSEYIRKSNEKFFAELAACDHEPFWT